MKDIKGYEDLYAITKDGRVWSYAKPCSSIDGMWMKQTPMVHKRVVKKDYLVFTTALTKKGKQKRFLVHRLVAITYIPNPENKPQVNHIDGNPSNNHVSNLEWSTGEENLQHAQRTGLLTQYTEKQRKARSESGKITGPINGMKSRRKFSFAEAECIRKIYKFSKKSYKAMARAYNCSDNTIRNICNNKSYLIDIEEI